MTRATLWDRLAAALHLRRLTKFGLVGLSGVGVNMLVLWSLTSVLHLHYLVAGALAVELALASNFTLNHHWTFADRAQTVRAAFLRYHAVALGGMVINLAVLHVLVGFAGAPTLAANLVGIAAGTGWNFLLSTRWAWHLSTRPS